MQVKIRTLVGFEYGYGDLEAYADENHLKMNFSGRDFFDDGVPNEVMALADHFDSNKPPEIYVFNGYANGAIYKRVF